MRGRKEGIGDWECNRDGENIFLVVLLIVYIYMG